MMHLLEGLPGQLGAGFGDRAAMNRFRLGPQATAAGMAEKGTGFAVNALVFTASGEGQQEDEEYGKRQFALTNKSFKGKMKVFRGETVWNELKKIIQNR
jgi:hypothetical protein